MIKQIGLGRSSKILVVSSIALSIGLAGVRPSAAGCGGYCEAMQVRAICHRAVTIQGLKGHERDVEFEKCTADPMVYLQVEELTDDIENSLD
jgi:hypothetical protein